MTDEEKPLNFHQMELDDRILKVGIAIIKLHDFSVLIYFSLLFLRL